MKTIMKFFDPKYIHKTYLVLAMTIGVVFSLLMPFFNEPDGQYHLAVSGRIVNSIIDTSRYHEPKVDSGMLRQAKFYKNGTRFETYYVNSASFVETNKVPRNIRFSYLDFTFWGHLIPGIGLYIGRLIYPSIGVMITFARILSVIVNTILVYFIIKKVQFAKLIYFLLFLSPVVLNSFASLSYDSTGFVAVAFYMMTIINLIANRSIDTETRRYLLISSISILLGAKWNYWLLLLFWPILEFRYAPYFLNYRKKINNIAQSIVSTKINIWLTSITLLFVFLVLAIIMTRHHGGLFYVIQRYIMTFGYNYAGMNLLSNDLSSWMVAPYPSQNYIPIWVTAVWYLMFFAVIFSETKFLVDRVIGLLFFSFFIIGVLGVYYTMLGYNNARTSYIEGVQGRYFTPTLLLLQVSASSIKPRLNEAARKMLPLFLVVMILISNTLLICDTIIGLVMR